MPHFVLVLSIAVLVLVIDALCFQVHGTGCRSFQAFVCIALFWHFFVLVLSIAVLVLVIDALCFQVRGTGCRVTIGSCVLPLQVQGPRAFLVRSMKRACLKLKRLQRMIHRRPEARGGSAGNASLQK